MVDMITLYNPTAAQSKGSDVDSIYAPRFDTLQGKVLGFIDNAKPNFNHLIDDIAELMVARHGIARVIKRQKRAASVPAPEAVYAEMVEHCDLVITGSGD
ncbi:MAG: hypothetical protein WCH96_09680 [Betaproteobacteria bacterium]|jgi:hypothetical protein